MAKASTKAAAKPKLKTRAAKAEKALVQPDPNAKTTDPEAATDAVINDMDPPTKAHAKATKAQFEAADFAARRAISGF
jgi:hypothetical protein